MTEIAIYVEGGGTTVDQKASLRRGFDGLFSGEKLESSKKRAKAMLGKFVMFLLQEDAKKTAYETFLNAIKP